MSDQNPGGTASKKMFLLTAARIFGILFSIIIPMYLGRKLSVETYGTYKQIMLFFWFSQVALNLGVDDSAYFYLKWEPKKFPLYCFNALIFNLLATGLLWLFMMVFATDISMWLNNPELKSHLPWLGYLIVVTVSSMQVEGILIGMDRFNERLTVEVGMEFFKSIAIMAGFYFFNSIQVVLVMLSVLMTLRLWATIQIIFSYLRKAGLYLSEAPQYFLSQLKFGLPLGLGRILQNVLNMENFFISSFFSLAQFTYYSVGCFENPLINAVRTSMYEIVNIEMVDGLRREGEHRAIAVWRDMGRKLFIIVIPMVTFMMFFAKEIMVFIFSEKYLPSVPFFMIFNLYLLVGCLNPEPLFRASSKTHLGLKIKVVGLLIGLFLLVAGAYWGGALWALVGKVVGVLIMNVIGLVEGAKLLKGHFFHLFSWKDLGKSAGVSLFFSALMAFLFSFVHWPLFWILAASFTLYSLLYILASHWLHFIDDEEMELIKKSFFRLFIFSKIKQLMSK